MCFHCKQMPDAANEITEGKYAAIETILWYVVKNGIPMYDACMLCWLAFVLGGFKEQFSGLKGYKAHVQNVTPEVGRLTN